jgi:hypothetical protein
MKVYVDYFMHGMTNIRLIPQFRGETAGLGIFAAVHISFVDAYMTVINLLYFLHEF